MKANPDCIDRTADHACCLVLREAVPVEQLDDFTFSVRQMTNRLEYFGTGPVALDA